MNTPAQGTVCICTLGCAKNEADSDAMRIRLTQAGYNLCDDPTQADVIIVNTCAFIQQATEESIDAVLEAFETPRVSRGEASVIVAGCMPARYGAELSAELPEAAAFLPCADEEHIVEAVRQALPVKPMPHPEQKEVQTNAKMLSAPYAYVKISDGCDRCCTYCTIPYIRGSYYSFPPESIEADVQRKISEGACEIVLVAQDTGRWGADLEGGRDLAWLISHLAESHPETLFRVMYIQPDGVSDALLSAIANHRNIASYLDVPLQHVSDRILKAMHRAGNRKSFEALVERIRVMVPGIALRTTFIAGFPGETEDEFQELLSFAGSGCFDYVGVFAYSREEGTDAASLPDQIDEDEKLYRAQAVQDAADLASSAVIAARCNTFERVLIEGEEDDGQLFGRTEHQAPEVDGVTYVDRGRIGTFEDVLIIDSLLYDLEGEVSDPHIAERA